MTMTKKETLQQIRANGLIAVLRGPSPELTVKMVNALVAGGVRGIEITLSTPDAYAVTAEVAARYHDQIVLGMGTLTEISDVDKAVAAGAQFLVSPVCEPSLVQAMVASGLVTMAGALTPTEVLATYRMGADVVKLFPGSLVGPSYIKSLHGPFPQIPLMPTGGVSADNVAQWLQAGAVAVGAGGELCSVALARSGKFDRITEIAREFVTAVKAAREGRAS
jgi:2-dehydro-3-deoxyphosphogluconate aldolase/(4S)-4-hydroxy-2-oxoglutarate aldolase